MNKNLVQADVAGVLEKMTREAAARECAARVLEKFGRENATDPNVAQVLGEMARKDVTLADVERVLEEWAREDAQEREERRQAVKAWLDSPDFPRGAGTLVFDAIGQALDPAQDIARLDDADSLLCWMQIHAKDRLLTGQDPDEDAFRYYVLHATIVALTHRRTEEEAKATEPFFAAAMAYSTAVDRRPVRLMCRTKREFREHLYEQIRRISNSSDDEDDRRVTAANALLAGSRCFSALRAYDGRRASVDIMCERLAGFNMAHFAKPIPASDEDIRYGSEAAVIAEELLRVGGKGFSWRKFIYGADDTAKSTAAKKLREQVPATPSETTAPQRRPR